MAWRSRIFDIPLCFQYWSAAFRTIFPNNKKYTQNSPWNVHIEKIENQENIKKYQKYQKMILENPVQNFILYNFYIHVLLIWQIRLLVWIRLVIQTILGKILLKPQISKDRWSKSKIRFEHLFLHGFYSINLGGFGQISLGWLRTTSETNVGAKKKAIWRFSLRILKENLHIAFFAVGFIPVFD